MRNPNPDLESPLVSGLVTKDDQVERAVSALEVGDGRFVGWSGLLYTSLSEHYGAPELQYMISGNMHGKGYATELAGEVLRHAFDELGLDYVIATVDIPNTGSIRVLEKLGFDLEGQIEVYGSDQMYLYRFRPAATAAH